MAFVVSYTYSYDDYLALIRARRAIGMFRGVGGVFDAPATPHAAAGEPVGLRLFDRIRALSGREQGVHGVWVRQVVLANPAP